jgi:hypothetical protein
MGPYALRGSRYLGRLAEYDSSSIPPAEATLSPACGMRQQEDKFLDFSSKPDKNEVRFNRRGGTSSGFQKWRAARHK